MSIGSQLGSANFGQYNFAEEFDNNYGNDSSGGAIGSRHIHVGFYQLGRRGYSRSVVWTPPASNANILGSVLIQFDTIAGNKIGFLGNDVQRPIIGSIEFTLDNNGCSNFKLILNELPDFEILPYFTIRIKFANSDFWWYTGEITDVPEYNLNPNAYEFKGFGYRSYLKNLKSDGDFTAGMDVGEVIDYIVQNNVVDETPIEYNEDKINTATGVILANAIELGKYSLENVFNILAEMANCRWGVDAEKEFYFETIEDVTSLEQTIFIGYKANEFEPILNFQDIRNVVTVTRQEGRGDGAAGWAVASVLSDASSVAKYGRKEETLQIPGYFSDTDADVIGQARLDAKKEPEQTAKINSYAVENTEDYFSRGNYRLIMPFGNFSELYSDVDYIADWNEQGGGDLILSEDNTYFLFADGSIKMTYTTSALSRAELTKNLALGKILQISFYLRADTAGAYLTAGVGLTTWSENTFTIDIPEADKFFLFQWDLSSQNITEINKFAIRIDENSVTENHVYIDRIQVKIAGFKYYKLPLETVTYNFSSGNQSADIEFGVMPKRMENYIKSLFTAASELKFTGEIR